MEGRGAIAIGFGGQVGVFGAVVRERQDNHQQKSRFPQVQEAQQSLPSKGRALPSPIRGGLEQVLAAGTESG